LRLFRYISQLKVPQDLIYKNVKSATFRYAFTNERKNSALKKVPFQDESFQHSEAHISRKLRY
jgi:hypothetical protein